MRVTWEVPSYNQRRYGKPWLAKVTAWPIGQAPQLDFGGTVDAWTAEIDASPGDILKRGQKDNRGNGTLNEFCWVLGDGTLQGCSNTDAREAWLARQPAAAPLPAPAPDLTEQLRSALADCLAYIETTWDAADGEAEPECSKRARELLGIREP